MKKIAKKVIVAVLAMAMVIGMMAMSAFAADKNTCTFTVKWDGAEGDMSLWIATCDDGKTWGINITKAQAWPGDAMTKNADGTYSITYDVPSKNVCLISSCSAGQTVDVLNVDVTKGNVLVTVDPKNADDQGHFAATAVASGASTETEKPADKAPAAGDSSVMIYIVAAVAALSAVVAVVAKRRSVEA